MQGCSKRNGGGGNDKQEMESVSLFLSVGLISRP